MILGIGFDLMDVGRVEAELARADWQPGEGIFTAGEIATCRALPARASRFAACFAAKEAALKALGVPADDLAMFREVELLPCDRHGYTIRLHDRLKRRAEQMGVNRASVSITRGGLLAGATVILES